MTVFIFVLALMLPDGSVQTYSRDYRGDCPPVEAAIAIAEEMKAQEGAVEFRMACLQADFLDPGNS